jgi:hypothetical protein
MVAVEGVKIKPPFKNAPNPRVLKITMKPNRNSIRPIDRKAKNELGSNKDLKP